MRNFSPLALCPVFRFLENFRLLTILGPMQLHSVVGVCPFQDLFVHLPTLDCDTSMNTWLILLVDLSVVLLALLVEIFRCVLAACQFSI